METSILFTNAAVQNQEFSLDEKPYKAVGVLAAQALNILYSPDAPEIYNWNNVGSFHKTNMTTPSERLHQKYESTFFQQYIQPKNKEYASLTDDDPMFSEWAKCTIEKALRKGYIYQTEEYFTVCSRCSITIAESAAGISTCSECRQNDSLSTKKELALFTNKREGELILPYEKIFNQINIRHEISTLNQLPHRFLLSRTRTNGVALDEFGLHDKKLDPRLGIGLLALYTAQSHNYDTSCIVQSISTLNRVAPYLSSTIHEPQAIGLPDYMYAFHSKIQPNLLHNPSIHPRILALYSLGQRADITDRTIAKITSETQSLENRHTIIASTQKIETSSTYPDKQYGKANLGGIVALTAKNLGRSLEIIKHGHAVSAEQEKTINKHMSTTRSLLKMKEY